MRRGSPLLLLLGVALAGAACQSNPPGRAAPTPGPRITLHDIGSGSGDARVRRGERIRFAVVGTGSGTHFGAGTFLAAPALDDLQVVAVVSTRMLWAQGLVSIAATDGPKDVASVSGGELAVGRDALNVLPTTFLEIGAPPTSSDAATARGGGTIDPAGDVDVFVVRPADFAAHELVVRLDRDPAAPADFHPVMRIADSSGHPIAEPLHGCTSIHENSNAPIYVVVADAARKGGADRRYRLSTAYGDPADCAAADPGVLVP